MKKPKHICICICTYKRSDLLKRLLSFIDVQEREDLFYYSVVIVDNDEQESARPIVESWSSQSKISVHYDVEPEQNISLARNRAVKNAKGDFIAFIDDDEYPAKNWLLNLYKAMQKYPSDGVLGPIISYFETVPPGWIVKGNLFDRKSFATGTVIQNVRYLRMGNVLLHRNLFDDKENLFDPRFGRTGGEDSDFFRRMMLKGKYFVWCDEACVNEYVPNERMNRTYLLRKAFLGGMSHAASNKLTILSGDTQKSFAAIILYTLALPLLLLQHHLFMKYLIKDCYHFSKIFAICGLRIVKERNSKRSQE
jgi:succinoglycan biosynthesis protein ExoM